MMGKILEPIDRLLNHTTMYRVVLYYLAVLLAGDFALGLFGIAQHDPGQLAFSVATLAAGCWMANPSPQATPPNGCRGRVAMWCALPVSVGRCWTRFGWRCAGRG